MSASRFDFRPLFPSPFPYILTNPSSIHPVHRCIYKPQQSRQLLLSWKPPQFLPTQRHQILIPTPYLLISALDSRTRHRHDLSVSAKTPSQTPHENINAMPNLFERSNPFFQDISYTTTRSRNATSRLSLFLNFPTPIANMRFSFLLSLTHF